jgi:hypothetical protein
VSCKKDKTEYGNIAVMMTDAPAGYQKVNVDIQQVMVHLVPAPNNVQWMNLQTNAGVYDLLTLQNGIDTTICPKINKLPAGKITEMRLILGNNNSVVVNNTVYPLTVPSGTNSGIKLPGPITVVANQTVTVLLDFNANQSVVQQGNGDYQLKPVIQVN